MIKLTNILEELAKDKVEYLSNAIIKMGVGTEEDLKKITDRIKGKLETGEIVTTPTTSSTDVKVKEKAYTDFFNDNNIKLTNVQKTDDNKYNIDSSISLFKFKQETFPIKLNTVKGNLELKNSKLKKLTNLPDKIVGNLDLTNSLALTSLSGITKNISGDLILTGCSGIYKIDDFPIVVNNVYLTNIISLKNIGPMLDATIKGIIYVDEGTFGFRELEELKEKFMVSITNKKKK